MGSVYLLLGDSATHCFELSNQIQRNERPGVELVFGVDLVEGDTAEAGTNGRVKIRCNPLLEFKVSRRDGVSADGPSGGIGCVGRGHSNGRAWAKSAPCHDVLGS